MENKAIIDDLQLFLEQSPTSWHAVDNICTKLVQNGYKEIHESDSWQIEPGKAYFVQRNQSALCAFITPKNTPQRVRLFASHTDSPGLKLKPKPEIRKLNTILLSVEVYGAPLLTSCYVICQG